MKSYIMCGMQNGDEGKGTYSDWLAHNTNAKCIVKYNGGCQASHTVVLLDGTVHKFAQLGAGMFKKGMNTFLTKEFIVNPGNLLREAKEFAWKNNEEIEDVLRRVHIHEDCLIVTPYHKLMNKLRELSQGDLRRGSVGTGVSEVPIFREHGTEWGNTDLSITMGMLYFESLIPVIGKLQEMQWYVEDFFKKNEKEIWKYCPPRIKEQLDKEINDLLKGRAFQNVAIWMDENLRKDTTGKRLKQCLYSYYEDTIRKYDEVIWEGSQGFLIDKEYGIKPNTTKLKTTNEPALDIAYYRDEIIKIGLIAPFTSRHGPGVLPTETKDIHIIDNNQQGSYWNGNPRYGWFDIVMFEYSQSVNNVDYIFVSQLDRLNGIDKLKICMCYEYKGEKDDLLQTIFDVKELKGRTFIIGIKNNHEKMKDYLKRCVPLYKEFEGWKDLDGVYDAQSLFERCGEFLETLYDLTGKTIRVISIGPTRDDKIVVPQNFELKEKFLN